MRQRLILAPRRRVRRILTEGEWVREIIGPVYVPLSLPQRRLMVWLRRDQVLPISESSIHSISQDSEKKIFRNLRLPSTPWNNEPLDHIGGRPIKEDPYPIHSGTQGLVLLPVYAPFDQEAWRDQKIFIDELEIFCGPLIACQTRIVLDKVAQEVLHPMEAMRTLIAIFDVNPLLIQRSTQFCPANYDIDLIVLVGTSGFIAALISQAHVTYYANCGAETFDRALFYRDLKSTKGRKIDLEFHKTAVPELFEWFPGAAAQYISRDGTMNFVIGRYKYDLEIFELPNDFIPLYETELSQKARVPTNLPRSPGGEYYFAWLVLRLKIGQGYAFTPLDLTMLKYYLKYRHTKQQVQEFCESIHEVGQTVPSLCTEWLESGESIHLDDDEWPVSLHLVAILIEAGVFDVDCARVEGLFPFDENHTKYLVAPETLDTDSYTDFANQSGESLFADANISADSEIPQFESTEEIVDAWKQTLNVSFLSIIFEMY
jgi:hypothetical protein